MAVNDGKTSSGEVESASEEGRALQRPGNYWIEVFSRFSRTLWGNRRSKKLIDAATELVKSESEFFTALSDHQRKKARLEDVPLEIETDRLDRRERLAEAKRKAENTRLTDEIFKKEKEVELLRLKNTEEALKRESNESDDPNERKLNEAIKKMDFEIAMKILQAKRAFRTVQELEKARDEMKADVLKETKGEPTPEQQHRIDNIDDFFGKLIAEVR